MLKDIGLKMLGAAMPEREIPWFSLDVDRSCGTVVRLSFTTNGQTRAIEKRAASDLTNVRDVLQLWPAVFDQLPSMARKVLSMIPIPKRCHVEGAPVRDRCTPETEHARLTMTAEVLGQNVRHQWDSQLNRLYMKDLLETFTFLKNIDRATTKSSS